MMQRYVWSDNSHDNMATQVPTQLMKEVIGVGNLRTTSKCSPQWPQVQKSFLLATQSDAVNGFLFSSFKDKMSRRSSYQRRWWEPLVTTLNTWPSTDPPTSNHSIVSRFPKERKVYVLQWLSRWWCLQYWHWGSLLQKWYVHWKQYSPAHKTYHCLSMKVHCHKITEKIRGKLGLRQNDGKTSQNYEIKSQMYGIKSHNLI